MIDSRGFISDLSLCQFFELEKRVVKIPRENDKGKVKQVKLVSFLVLNLTRRRAEHFLAVFSQ